MLLSFLPLFIIECIPLILATVIYEIKLVYFIFFDKRERPISPRYSIESVKFLPWEIPEETKTWQGGLVTWVCSIVWFFSEITLDLILIAMGKSVENGSKSRGSVGEKEEESCIENQLRQQQQQYSNANTKTNVQENSHLIDEDDADDDEMVPYPDDEVDEEMIPYDEPEAGEKSTVIESFFEYMAAEMFIEAENEFITQESIEYAVKMFNTYEKLGAIEDTIRFIAPMLSIHEAIYTIDGHIESANFAFKSCEAIYALDNSIELAASMFVDYEAIFNIDALIEYVAQMLNPHEDIVALNHLIESVAPMFETHETVFAIDGLIEHIAPMIVSCEAIYSVDDRIESAAAMFKIQESIFTSDSLIESLASMFTIFEAIYATDERIERAASMFHVQESLYAADSLIESLAPMFVVHETICLAEESIECIANISTVSEVVEEVKEVRNSSQLTIGQENLESMLHNTTSLVSDLKVAEAEQRPDIMAPLSPANMGSESEFSDVDLESENEGSIEDSSSHFDEMAISPVELQSMEDIISKNEPQTWFERKAFSSTSEPLVQDLAAFVNLVRQSFAQSCTSPILSPTVSALIHLRATHSESRFRHRTRSQIESSMINTIEIETVETEVIPPFSIEGSSPTVEHFEIGTSSEYDDATTNDSSSPSVTADISTAAATTSTSSPKKKKNKNKKKKKKTQGKATEKDQDGNSTDDNIESRIFDLEVSLNEIDHKFKPLVDMSLLNSLTMPTVSTLAACSLVGKSMELGSVTATTKENGDFDDYCLGTFSSLAHTTSDRKPSRESMCA